MNKRSLETFAILISIAFFGLSLHTGMTLKKLNETRIKLHTCEAMK